MHVYAMHVSPRVESAGARGRAWRLTCAAAVVLAWICHVTHATPAEAPGGGGGVAPCDVRDAAALRELYDATGGPAWTVGWDMPTNCCGWHGVGCDGDGRVTRLCVPHAHTRASMICHLVTLARNVFLLCRLCFLDIASCLFKRRLRCLGARDLRSNGLRGTVPISISALSALREM